MKLKSLIVMLIIIFPGFIYSQVNQKLTLSFYYSPEYAYRQLLNSDSLSSITKKIRDQKEQGIMGYTSGVLLGRKLFSIIAFEYGVMYSQRGFKYDSSSISGNYNLAVSYYYNFLQIPFRLKAYIKHKRYNFYVTGGITGMVLLNTVKNSVETVNGTPNITKETLKDNALQQLNYSVLFGAGVDYRLLNRLYFRVEPTYSKTLSSIRKETLKTLLVSGGVNVGLTFVLKKSK